MGDRYQASIAYTMGNLGASTQAQNAPDLDGHDDEDFVGAAEPYGRAPWWIWLRGRAIRWSLAAGVFLAYINHWPGGH